MRLAFARLVNPGVGILTGLAEISHMPEQVPAGVLHSQVAKMRPDSQKHDSRLPPGPTLDRQGLYQYKPATVKHLVQ
jgi:hypothetical protein